MINSIVEASKIFDSTIRIQILASLSTSSLTYNQLKKVCRCADGAMTNHTSKLEQIILNKKIDKIYFIDFLFKSKNNTIENPYSIINN